MGIITIFFILIVILLIVILINNRINSVTGARAIITGPHGERGQVLFTKYGAYTAVSAKFSGLEPGLHGMHIHEIPPPAGADPNTLDCKSLGPHYNPYKQNHGDRLSIVRHVGDMGNIKINEDGTGELSYVDKIIKIPDIIGKAIVVHENADDLGLGGNPESLINGNSGMKLVCAVIRAV